MENKTRTAKPSEKLLQSWMTALAGKFAANREFTVFEAEATKEMLLRQVQKHESESVNAAVKRAIVDCQFMPTEEQIEQRIPRGQKMKAMIDPACKSCGGTGWKPVNQEDRCSPVNRCHCRVVMPA